METELQQLGSVYRLIAEFLVNYSFQIVGAVIILLIGLYVARRGGMLVERVMLSHHMDVTLSHFAGVGIKVLLLAMVAIIALGKVGISVTPFVAAVGALSLGAGLALQGMLANYGAGVCIIVTRPFVVGDTISVQGVSGVVKVVQLGHTVLSNEDDVRITIPNKHIVGEIIHNSFADTIVETAVTIGYQHDPELAMAAIRDALRGLPALSTERPPQVEIEAFADHGFRLGIRFWVRTSQQFQARGLALAAILQALRQHQLTVAVPQQDIRLVTAASPQDAER